MSIDACIITRRYSFTIGKVFFDDEVGDFVRSRGFARCELVYCSLQVIHSNVLVLQ
jgi:hypothetical protein